VNLPANIRPNGIEVKGIKVVIMGVDMIKDNVL
jgi:hypothetical protein